MKPPLLVAGFAFVVFGLSSLPAQEIGYGQPDAKTVRTSIRINAAPEKVWTALTTPALIKQWFLGVDTQTDWKVGSPIVHRGEWQGKPYEAKGKIIAFEPGRILAHDHWSKLSGLPDTPENHQIVRYGLIPDGQGSLLALTEENIPDKEKRDLSEKTWNQVLANLKTLVETGGAKP
jgi:uncharacterized protein YndB with AHSA1/START domain